MPLYDYLCQGCGVRSELLVRGGGAAPACPACGSEALERLLSLPAVRSAATRDVVGRSTQKRDAAQARERVNQQAAYERNHD